MPLLPYTHTFIEVPVADRTSGGTTFKQKARFLEMRAAQNPVTGQVTVTIRVRVDLYAVSADDLAAFGELLTGKGLSSYEVLLVADNNSAVHAQTGQLLYMRTTETNDEWQELLAGKDEPLLLQGDFFEALMNTQPVEIGPMLRQFMEQADQPPFSKFA